MAIVTWPLSSAEARGRVGGLIYNTWRGRSYVKSYALHQGEFTPAQIGIRAVAAQVTAAWQVLDLYNRRAWEDFSISHLLPTWSGTPKRISAYNWFMKLNWNALYYFNGPYDTPPQSLPAYILEDPGASYTAPDIWITWTAQPYDPENTWLIQFWLEGPYLHRRTPSIKRARLWDAIDQAGTPYQLTPPSSGWFGIHLNAIALCGHSIRQTNFMIEVP